MLLALVLTLGCLPGVSAAEANDLFAVQTESKLYGLDPQTVQTYAEDDEVTAIVLLDGEPTAAAAEPTRAATRLARQHESLRKTLRQSRVAYTEQFDYTTLLNGVAVRAAYGDLQKIARLPGVASVHVANTYDPPEATVQMASSNKMTGAARFQEAGYTGSGTVIAVLDTGITPQHEALAVYDGNSLILPSPKKTPRLPSGSLATARICPTRCPSPMTTRTWTTTPPTTIPPATARTSPPSRRAMRRPRTARSCSAARRRMRRSLP